MAVQARAHREVHGRLGTLVNWLALAALLGLGILAAPRPG
jgi:hypothetical protein